MKDIYYQIANATMDATKLIKKGKHPTDAVEKVARDYSLNLDTVDRVVEAINTAQALTVLRSGNRRQEFPLAEGNKIKSAMLAGSVTRETMPKAAEISKDYYAEYLEDKYLPRVPLLPFKEKAPRLTADDLMPTVSRFRKVASMATMELPQLQLEFCNKLSQLPKQNLKQYLANGKTLGHVYAEKTAEFIKQAAGFSEIGVAEELIDEEEYSVFSDLCDIKQNIDHLEKIATHFDDLVELASSSLNTINIWDKPLDVDTPLISSEKYAKDKFSEKCAGILGSLKALVPAVGAVGKAREINKAKSTDITSIKNFLDTSDKAKMLRGFSQEDEILKDYMMKDIVAAYNTLEGISPKAAANPHIAKAFLRKAVMHPEAIEAFEAGSYADLERKLLELDALKSGDR